MAKEHVHGVFEAIAEGYDAANDRISLGMHRFWKRALCDAALNACCNENRAGLVLDVCCGTGDITQMLAQRAPGVLVCGLDFSAHMLEVAEHRLRDVDNVMLVEGNAMQLPFDDDTFDSTVVSFGLRNTPDYKQVISEMVRVTRPGGIVACLDASVPDSDAIKPFYQLYYKNIMTLLGGGLSNRKEYEWLYESTQEFLRKDELARLFEECGLISVTVRSFMFGAAALHVGVVPLFASAFTSHLADTVKNAAQTLSTYDAASADDVELGDDLTVSAKEDEADA